MNTDKILIMSVAMSLFIIGLVGSAYADMPISIMPLDSSKITQTSDGYSYSYDFVVDSHNQEIMIQSVDFIINNTDTTQYNLAISHVNLQGEYGITPLSSINQYVTASTIEWQYDHSSAWATPMFFATYSKNSTSDFNLSLVTPFKITDNIGVSLKIHYTTKDGILHIVKSEYLNIQNKSSAYGIIWCSDDNCGTPKGYNFPLNSYTDCGGVECPPQLIDKQTENQKILNKLETLIQLQNQTNNLLAYNYCKGTPTILTLDYVPTQSEMNYLNNTGKLKDNPFQDCVNNVLGVSK